MQDALSLLQAGRFAEALAVFEAALARDPRDAGALFGRATALQQLGRLAEAKTGFDALLLQQPDAAGARVNRGDTLLSLGQPAEALGDFDHAIARNPAIPQAHLGRGIALQRLLRPEESLACFDRALQLWPECADAFFFSALSLERLDRTEEAVAQYDKALALVPHSAAAIGNRATMLMKLKRFAEAETGFRLLERLKPGNPDSLNGLAFIAAQICDWREWQSLRARIAAGGIVQPGTLICYSSEPGLVLACVRNFIKPVPRAARPSWRGTPFSNRKVRLGYCSADFNAHATSWLMVNVWERHDRDHFEVMAFETGLDDGSPMRARVRKAFDQFHVLGGKSPAVIAAEMAAAGVDIALDLNGPTAGARSEIFAHRPAPVQVNYLGFPGTTGAEFMDYVLGDAVVTPLSQQAFYPEKILHLPECYQPNDASRARPPAPIRAEAGLPEQGFVFCSFNNNWKISPPMFDVWMRLLKAVPGSILWLLQDNPQAAANLRLHAAARGVAENRLVFAPRVDGNAHLARHAHAGLMLDTSPYNAHTTASDALWMGLPIVTLLGEGFAGRVAASLLGAVGLGELVTANLQEYEALALALARDPARLAGLKQKLEANRLTCALFDSARFTRNLEAAFEKMRADYLA